MKTKEIVQAYGNINSAKLTKMEDSAKFKVIKALRVLKSVNNSYEDFMKDAQEKLKDEKFEEMREKAQKWQEEGEKTSLSMEERVKINKFFTDYNAKVAECVKEENEKEHDLSFEKLTEDEFKAFMSSNDFDVQTIMNLQDILMY